MQEARKCDTPWFFGLFISIFIPESADSASVAITNSQDPHIGSMTGTIDVVFGNNEYLNITL